MKDFKSLQALITLMDDPDELVYAHVKDRLLEFGPDAVQLLESSWEEKDYGILFQSRIETLIHEIQFAECKRQLNSWYHGSTKNLLRGATIIAKYQYPGLDQKQIYDFIERICRDCWLELNPNMTAFESIRIINKVFFGQYGFSGNSRNYNSPLNSFINTVIETRKGNPLSLSILYSLVAQELKLPIYGVNLPNHFVLAYMDNNGVNQFISNGNEYGVLFYINAFSRGSVLQKDDIIQFLSSIQVAPQDIHFQPCSNSDIIRRMLTNLIASFQQNGNSEKVNELIELRSLLV
ncbi:transglutaminase-like domain-containing protein [Fluviicola sp.]|jgi:regulator of sirC expression with transglutaminase-like and TPR domain|uniref:transglutaminase-like domain-containing protein n=1 Tax=Fluviicola sp. TaxID=1917219 RepID=UPI00282A8974|nr:transglutaminase-like domain-containing protein [Fluviicola sp.]MDR0801288.1 transglutaminase-like domain-containing protein [Fluviicola sp.]